MQDLNLQPSGLESDALPVELMTNGRRGFNVSRLRRDAVTLNVDMKGAGALFGVGARPIFQGWLPWVMQDSNLLSGVRPRALPYAPITPCPAFNVGWT